MIDELIVRLETTTDQDRDLDARICYAVKPALQRCGSLEAWLETNAARVCPTYTFSIDDALTLVPKDHAWSLRRNVSGDGDVIYCNAQVWRFCNPRDDETPTHWANSNENAPAIALCLAALKARAALTAPYQGKKS